jgi:hypothetical protein
LLAAYTAGKRSGHVSGVVRRLVERVAPKAPLARCLYVGHATFGLLSAGVVLAHATTRVPPSVAGALSIVMLLAVVSGATGALLAAFVPRRLSRLERASVLPEELAARPKAIEEQIFAALSGKSEAVKGAFAKTLGPYRRQALGPVLLALSGRSLRDEEARLTAEAGPSSEDLRRLVRLVVEHRAVRAQRLFTWVLRGFAVPHVAFTVAVLVLMVLHVASVAGGP